MLPYDLLSEQDKVDIENWITNVGLEGKARPRDLKKSLRYWNEAKNNYLFRVFGNKLKIEFPVEVEMTDYILITNLEKIFSPIGLNLRNVYGEKSTNLKSGYINYLARWITEKCDMEWTSKRSVQTLFLYNNFIAGHLEQDYFIEANGKELKLKQGTKIIKALKKLNNFLDFPFENDFEIFRNKISDISTVRSIKGTFVLSIHPIDYMTMSDNNCDWTSCMSWRTGSYCGGTLEMMNSDCAVVGYLKSDTPFSEEYPTIDNKQWRSLYYVNQDILFSGKPYPYECQDLTLAGLDELKNLVYNNLKWDYEMTCPFDDVTLTLIKDSDDARKGTFYYPDITDSYGLIIPYTYGMYNDIVSDIDTNYYCYRNPVEDCNLLCVSGRANCMLCGELMDSQYPEGSEEYNNLEEQKYESHGPCVNCEKCEKEGRISFE